MVLVLGIFQISNLPNRPLIFWLHTLWASSQGALVVGREKKGLQSLRLYLQFLCGTLLTELSDFHQSAWSRNKCKCKQTLKTCAKDNDIITNGTSANQHFTSTFRCRYLNSRDVVASSPSFSHITTRRLWRACSQATDKGAVYIEGGGSLPQEYPRR